LAIYIYSYKSADLKYYTIISALEIYISHNPLKCTRHIV
jgi:hypothetical protein